MFAICSVQVLGSLMTASSGWSMHPRTELRADFSIAWTRSWCEEGEVWEEEGTGSWTRSWCGEGEVWEEEGTGCSPDPSLDCFFDSNGRSEARPQSSCSVWGQRGGGGGEGGGGDTITHTTQERMEILYTASQALKMSNL